MRVRNWMLLLVFGLLLSVVVACSGGDTEETPEAEGAGDDSAAENEEQVLNLTNPEAIPSMDPSLATDESSFIYLAATMEGLYRLDENAAPVDGMAIDHEVSEDGLTWTFMLREDG